VRVFRQRNRGASIARNVGIRHARSALIALLDDDDRMLPDRLAAQVAVMDDTSIGLCHTQCRLINEHGTVIGEGAGRESQYNDFLRGDGAILLSSTMVRKELVEDVGGFNPLLPLGEDLDFLYRLARESAFRFLPEVLTEYRVHGANTWAGSAKGGAEVTSILTQHLFVARARAEHEHVAAINHGLSLIPSDRVAQAMLRAHDARARRRYAAMIVALAMAMVCAPVFTLKAVRRAVRKLARPSAVS
jgi:glycosyltransferase involved in cell wall biosynthesis